jgi:hypothetical protein
MGQIIGPIVVNCINQLVSFGPGHFLGHEKQQAPVALIRTAQQAAELGQHAGILPGTAPLVA